MSSPSPFVHHVTDLLTGRTDRRDIDFEAPVDFGVELHSVRPAPPMEVVAELIAVSDGMLARGEARYTAVHRCSRCLAEVEEEESVDFAQLVYRPDQAPEDADYVIEGDEVDLEPIVRDEIILGWPVQPSCGPECPGLGSITETDLNIVVPPEESPFAALRELLPEAPD